MDGETIQQRIYYGYAKASQYIGLPFAQYRPSGATNPTQGAPLNAALLASFNPKDMTYGKAQDYAKATWYCLADGSQLAPFDYLVGVAQTYYVASMVPLLPILAVACNTTLSITRPQLQTEVGGITDYEGTTADNETPLMTAFPASVLQGSKGEKGEVVLPGDVRNAWWIVLIPYAGVTLRSGDIIYDTPLNRRYIISSAELTELGYRITAIQGQT